MNGAANSTEVWRINKNNTWNCTVPLSNWKLHCEELPTKQRDGFRNVVIARGSSKCGIRNSKQGLGESKGSCSESHKQHDELPRTLSRRRYNRIDDVRWLSNKTSDYVNKLLHQWELHTTLIENVIHTSPRNKEKVPINFRGLSVNFTLGKLFSKSSRTNWRQQHCTE